MDGVHVGFLHPGEMGVSLAAAAKRSGCSVYWASEGRGPETRRRAEANGLIDLGTIAGVAESCNVVVSICPPHAAEEVAGAVLAAGYRALYVEANAISPGRSIALGDRMRSAGAGYVDGGVIGGPAWEEGKTRLYLSGPEAERAAGCFRVGPPDIVLLGAEIGRASALKMTYAAYTKGTSALLCAVLATAEALGVREALEAEWSRDDVQSPEQAHLRVRRATRKAWRFAGEMDEIADTCAAAGIPDGFHRAAGETFGRLAGFRGEADLPALERVLKALRGGC